MTTPPPEPPAPGPDTQPLLTQRALLVLLTATVLGAFAGVLAFLSTANAAGALLAGMTAAGASTLGLHKLID